MEALVFCKNIEGHEWGMRRRPVVIRGVRVKEMPDESTLLYKHQPQTLTKWNQNSKMTLSTRAFHPSRKQGTKQLYKDPK